MFGGVVVAIKLAIRRMCWACCFSVLLVLQQLRCRVSRCMQQRVC
jgi:hypothetical protein